MADIKTEDFFCILHLKLPSDLVRELTKPDKEQRKDAKAWLTDSIELLGGRLETVILPQDEVNGDEVEDGFLELTWADGVDDADLARLGEHEIQDQIQTMFADSIARSIAEAPLVWGRDRDEANDREVFTARIGLDALFKHLAQQIKNAKGGA